MQRCLTATIWPPGENNPKRQAGESGQHMKKLLCGLALFFGIGAALVLGGCLCLAFYYRNHFPVNTWLNGVYCTGKTIEQVNLELSRRGEAPSVTVAGADGQRWQIELSKAGGRADYLEALKRYLRKSASMLWFHNLGNPRRERLEPTGYGYVKSLLLEQFEQSEPVRQAREAKPGVTLEYTGQGYVLRDGNTNRLMPEEAFAYLEECLAEGKTYVDLAEGGCYETIEDSPRDLKQREIWDKLQAFFDREIIYDMGAETIPLTPDITSRFLAQETQGILALDEKGDLMLDEEGVRGWVEELAKAYDTVGTTLSFAATRGDVVEVAYDTYGTKLNVEAETAYLLKTLEGADKGAQIHVPAYEQEGFARGLDDIGGTYIEVDMTGQHLYYYVDGTLTLETDVVTGNTGRRMGTPEGVNFVYNKQRNRTLIGPGYASPVKYWVPVRGRVGIHDASWRSSFGGEIYRTNGSHGCINTPTEAMERLYEAVEIGTPVILFY